MAALPLPTMAVGFPSPSGAVSVEVLPTRHSLQAGPCGALPRPLQFAPGAHSRCMPWHGWWLSAVP